MKKVLFLIISALLCFPAAEAEISGKAATKSSDNYSHWSIMLSGGFNMLITERMADWQEYKWEGRDFSGKGLSANYVDNFSFSGLFQADYMFTPQFGLRFQYLYAPINKKAIYTFPPYYDADNNLRFFSNINGQSHQLTLQLEINLLNLFYRCRQNTQWGWYIGTGVGAMFYDIPTTENSNTPQLDGKYRPIVTIPFNTSVEYSPISSLSVVFHAELDWYGDDELNGYEDNDGQVNDMGLYVGVGLRYNICATKDPHVRLNDMCSYEPLTVGRSRKTAKFKTGEDDDDDNERQTDKEDIQELQDKMDELEKRNRELQDKIDLMNRDIMERLDKYFQDNSSGSPDGETNADKSGSESKSKSPSSSSNGGSSSSSKGGSSSTSKTTPGSADVPTPPDLSSKPDDSSYKPSASELKQQQVYVEAMQSNGTEANEVIFDLSSSRVKAKYEIKVATVARRMLANKKLKLDIFAYLTKEELTKSNVKLATERLQAIYFILVNRYRIDPNRIKYDILEPSEGDEGSDIRCDMVYR